MIEYDVTFFQWSDFYMQNKDLEGEMFF